MIDVLLVVIVVAAIAVLVLTDELAMPGGYDRSIEPVELKLVDPDDGPGFVRLGYRWHARYIGAFGIPWEAGGRARTLLGAHYAAARAARRAWQRTRRELDHRPRIGGRP